MYARAMNRPGLLSPNFKPLKTWHVVLRSGASACGEAGTGCTKALDIATATLPANARLCVKCKATICSVCAGTGKSLSFSVPRTRVGTCPACEGKGAAK